MDELHTFAVKRAYDGISILNHRLDGSSFEACYFAGDIPELIALLQTAYTEWADEQMADYAAECEQLNAAEARAIQDRETRLELDYDAKFPDPFPDDSDIPF